MMNSLVLLLSLVVVQLTVLLLFNALTAVEGAYLSVPVT